MSKNTPVMPGIKIFQRVFEQQLGMERTGWLMPHVRELYAAYYRSRPRFTNRAMQKTHLENSILPGVVLYQSLLNEKLPREEALSIVKQCLEARSLPRRRVYILLGKLPFFYTLLRQILRLQIRFVYPPEGWKLEWTIDSRESIGFNVYSCVYMNMFGQYGVPELTSVFCQMDEIFYDGVSSFLYWQRRHTLGSGGTLCDFRFYRGKKATNAVLKPLI